MFSFENDTADLNAELAEKPTRRFIVVQRKTLAGGGGVVQFRLYDHDTREEARACMSRLVDEFRRDFHIVFLNGVKEMLMEGDRFEHPYFDGATYTIEIFDALDLTEENAEGYVWRFDGKGVPVSCSGVHGAKKELNK